MKKKIFLLPCIAAFAIATFVGAKALRSNASESNALLMANVEALSEDEWENLDNCYFNVFGGDTPEMPKQLLECPSGTTPNRITKCPSTTMPLYESAPGKCRKS